jgi:glycosyltransferase 2 family protein
MSSALVWKLAIAMIVGAVSYGALLLYADSGLFTANLDKLTPIVLFHATLWSMSNFLVRGLRWEYYLRRLGLRLAVQESVLVFLAGFAMSITPAKSGEVLKSLMLRASSDMPLARTASIVVAERTTDVAGLVLLAGLGLSSVVGRVWILGVSIAAVLVLALVAGSRRAGRVAIDFLTQFRRTRRLRQKLLEAHSSLLTLVTAVPFLIGTVLSVIAWSTHGVALWVIAKSFPGCSLTLTGSMLAYSSPLLAGTLAMIPGGLGLTEASMIGVLARMGGPGITLAVASTISIVVRILTFWLAIAIGFLALALWELRRRVARGPLG